MSDKAISLRAGIGTLSITMVTFTAGATTPALNTLFLQFADEPQWAVSLISTIVSLGTVIGVLLFGAVANGRIKFKTIANTGMLTSGFFGVLPAFWNDSLAIILICRFLCGFGVGFIMSMGATWFMRCIRDREKRGHWLSWNQAVGSAGGVVFTLLGGWLAEIQWNYCFLSFLFTFVAWAIMLFTFREPKSVEQIIEDEGTDAGAEFEKAKSVKLSGYAWIFVILYTLYQLLLSQGLMLLSTFMDATGAGGAGVASILLSVFCIVTALGCAVGGWIIKALGRWTSPLCYLLLAVGMFLLIVSSNIVGFAIAVILFGLGACIGAFINFEISLVTSPAGLAWAAVLIMVGGNLGNFLSSFLLGGLQAVGGTNGYFPVEFACGGFLVLFVVFVVVNLTNKKSWGKEARAHRDDEGGEA